MANVEGPGTADSSVDETVSVSTDMLLEAPKAEKSNEPASGRQRQADLMSVGKKSAPDAGPSAGAAVGSRVR